MFCSSIDLFRGLLFTNYPSIKDMRNSQTNKWRRVLAHTDSMKQQLALATTHSQAPNRLYGFDTLRAIAILLVILAHAAAPYVVHPMPGLLWPIQDVAPSSGIGAIFWWIVCFIMALFFAMSGFFTAQLMQKRGPRAFLVNRCKRLLVPLLVASAVILPITAYIWVLGWVLDGKYPPVKLRSFKFDEATERQFWGFAHLWFLQYLFLYCLAFWGVKKLWQRRDRGDAHAEPKLIVAMRGGTVARYVMILAPIACAAMLWIEPRVILGFHQSIAPVPTRLFFFAIFFVFGICLCNRRGWVEAIQRYNLAMLIGALFVFTVLWPLIQTHLETELTGGARVVLVGLVTLFAWLMTCGLLGFFTRSISRPGKVTRYLADASYWLYLTHLPFVGVAHVLLAQTNWVAWIKFVLSYSLALGVTLLGYRLLVRNRRLGSWLDGAGRRDTKRKHSTDPSETERGRMRTSA